MKWLGSITNSKDMNMSKLWEIVEDTGACCIAVHGVTKSQTWLCDWMTTITFIICKKLHQNPQKSRLQNKQKNWIDNCFKKDMQMANRHMKGFSASLVIRAMQIKTTMRYLLILVRMAIIKKNTTNVDEDVEKWEPSYTVGENVNWCSHCGKQYGVSSKN